MELAVLDPKSPTTLAAAKTEAEAISRALRRAARQSRAPAPLISGGAGIRARKGDRAFRWGVLVSFLLVVACPTLISATYWGLIASKQYVAEAKFALRSGQASVLDSIGGFAGLPGSQQAQDTQILVNYIRSRAIVESLQKRVDFTQIFSRDGVDRISRLPANEPIEDLEKYWRKRVDVSVETSSGIVSLNIRAFTPEDAVLLAKNVIDLSESLVNDMSTRSREDALTQSRAELTRAEKNLQLATAALRDKRNAEGVVDAATAAEGIGKLVTNLRLQLSQAEADLAAQGETVAENAPQARVLKARIANLKDQIRQYSNQIAGGLDADGENMAGRLGALSGAQIDLDLARQQYAQGAIAYEAARVDLETQHAYLVSFLQPTLPEKSTYPRRWWECAIIVLPSCLAWSLLVGAAFMIRDHRKR